MKLDGLGDWSIRATSTLAKSFTSADGHVYKVGTPVTLMTVTEVKKSHILSFTTPSASALALSIAIRAVRRAKEMQESLILKEKTQGHEIPHHTSSGRKQRITLIASDTNLYDFFEECMIAVAFSFQSLETFANTIIAEKLGHPYLLKRREENLELSADELQRKASTEEKLGTVLPEILSTESPKGKKVWQDFKQLKRVRDTTIHMKALDAYSGTNIDRETFFYKLLQVKAIEFPRIVIDMIAYFSKDEQLPRWLISAREKIR